MSTSFFAIGLIIIATIISGFAPILLKRGSAAFTINLRTLFKKPSALFLNYWLILGIGFDVFAAILNVIALRFGELSVLTPLTSLTYIWACVFSNRYLNERITGRKIIGILLIVLGVVLVTAGRTA